MNMELQGGQLSRDHNLPLQPLSRAQVAQRARRERETGRQRERGSNEPVVHTTQKNGPAVPTPQSLVEPPTRAQISQRMRREREREASVSAIPQISASLVTTSQSIPSVASQQTRNPSPGLTPSRRTLARRARAEREFAFRSPFTTESIIGTPTQVDQQSVVTPLTTSSPPSQDNISINNDARAKGKNKSIDVTPTTTKRTRITSSVGASGLVGALPRNFTKFLNFSFTKSTRCVGSSSTTPPLLRNIEPIQNVMIQMQPVSIRPPSLQTTTGGADHQFEGNTETDSYEDDMQNDDSIEPPIMRVECQHFLGKMDVVCTFCKALHWKDERLSTSLKHWPLFGKCCKQGKIELPLLRPLPPYIQQLYDGNDSKSRSFREHIREYNAANAFTSLGAKLDDRLLKGRGPTPFTIHGELRHQIGSLLPESGKDAMYAQLYIYDPGAALGIRHHRNPHLRVDVLDIIQQTLLECNAFCKTFRQAYAIMSSTSLEDNDVTAYLHYTTSTDRRRYNVPSTNEIAVILPGDGSETSSARDIILHLNDGNALMRIHECHPAYLPLHYVLLYPYGELGWSTDLTRLDAMNCDTARLTQMGFYSYRLFQRHNEYSPILRAGKLFQEFMVDAWASTEQNRLTYYRLNQDELRAELYSDLVDVPNGLNPYQVGKRYILPSSFTGSPRHMFEIFQDSMAITRFNKHPDIFLTMTANPNWPEIQDALLPHQNATDRPDLVARVFELKRKALMKMIKDEHVFGREVAHVYTIEFQKRGLPHMHALFFLGHADKIHTTTQVDQFVSAEFPDPNIDPVLFHTIKNCMIHGPCGARNKHASCMEDEKCTKRYPRSFSDETTMDKNGYPRYRRRETGQVYNVRGHEVDNRDVVPHNPLLTRTFNCHINVEVCAGLQCVKYIHKYIYKGHDRSTMVLGGADEIQQYIDARYIGPPEAAWRIFGHSLHEEVPTVVRLALHLPGMHQVVFNPNESMETILARADQQQSSLTAFFACCASKFVARQYTYQEFPQHFVWHKQSNKWTERERGFAIGRMYFASPNSGEKFYLRLLLTVVRGPTSFQCLKTVNNVPYLTFKSACVARGLLEDDQEWIQCLEEAIVMNTGYQLRRLFCVILKECNPLNPNELWDRFSTSLCDDLAYKMRRLFFIPNPTVEEVADYGLHMLEQLLLESRKTLADFPPMPRPTRDWNTVIGNRLIFEQRELQYDGLEEQAQCNIERLNDEQRHVFSMVTDSVIQNAGKTFFLNGAAGTGKTFAYNTIAAKCRSLGYIVIGVASSGIASLLLDGGRTAHSTFGIPLDVLENSVCGFTKQSLQAELFRETRLIIWDEVPMQHRFCIEAVDRTLRDVCENNNPFGGITVLLGGDFRQILPVIPKGVREEIVAATLIRSWLWRHVQVLSLVHNMRLENSDQENLQFANFLVEVGTKPEVSIQLPPAIQKVQSLENLLLSIYPRLNEQSAVSQSFLTERTILSARNDDVAVINDTAIKMFPGEAVVCFAADKISEEDVSDNAIVNRYPNEYLNSLNPSGLPPFELKLKVGSPVMLLRNIAPCDGLCNGTRLMVVRCSPHVVQVRILTGAKAGNVHFVPRISLTPSSADLPFDMTRRQFPIRLSFAMTINKSQGQSVKYVGIDLRNPVFSHGQLYVALSRCTSSKRITVILPPGSSSHTTNIVYPEVLF